MIVVTGVTGTTGGATLMSLLKTDAKLRVLVRDAGKFRAPAGVEVVVGDFADVASLKNALSGVEKVYMVLNSSPDAIRLESNVVDAAVEADVKHIVCLTVVGADQPGIESLRFGLHHKEVEAYVVKSGLPYTFLRPNGFMQNYLGQAAAIAGQNAFYSPLTPSAIISHVDARDIGDVAAAVLTEDGHQGKAYTLTGPHGLNDDQVADALTSALGHEVKHVQIPAEDAKKNMVAMGWPEWNVEGIAELWSFYETGHAGQVTNDIETVLGRPAGSFETFARDHREILSPQASPAS